MQCYTAWITHVLERNVARICQTDRVLHIFDDMYYHADDMLKDFGQRNKYFENMKDESNPMVKEF